ncbi:MAG: glycosyltransferase [Spirochaetales bacterium]|nr:glycosyltransferase [Spirochaetales bacterium]
MVLQELIFPYIGDTELYFRIDNGKIENKEILLNKNGTLKTNTFFNIFSSGKWFKYTDLQDLSLSFSGTGKAKLEIFRINNEKESEQIIYSADLQLDKNPILELPINIWQINDCMIFFSLTAYETVTIKKIDYITNTSVNTDVVIALNICTYKREEYLKANLSLLEEQILNNPQSQLYNKLEVFIADNGKTLGDSVTTNKIHVFPNANTGGSGGFTRGLQEILAVSDEKKITHTIFMDDDIKLIPAVIERNATFLSFIKDKFADSIIPGAMLNMNNPNNQYEFGAKWDNIPRPQHMNLDLLDVKTLTCNDKENIKIDYAAWWYSCMSIQSLKRIGYPMPFFIHGDDIEYGLRLNHSFILLNGIGVWHESFENKYQPVNIYYDTRNYLIINTLYNHQLKIINHIFNNIFWQTSTYRYWDVDFFLKGIKDFCKGANWLLKLNSEKNHIKLSEQAKKAFSCKSINNLPNDFTYIKNASSKTYNKWKFIFMLNGWLLPANKNIVLDIGTDAHEMYRVKKAIWFFPQTKQGIEVKKSFFPLFKIGIQTIYTCILVIFKYKKAQKSYKKDFDKLCRKS